MCGIFAVTGDNIVTSDVVGRGLRVMEYRGYDSWGLGYDDGEVLKCLKSPGRVPGFLPRVVSGLAIGHTRWATHGGITTMNAHPHLDCTGQIGVVHNGVIENFSNLKQLVAGHPLQSETDTEVIAHLIENERHQGRTLFQSLLTVFGVIHGSNAVVACDRRTGEIAAATSGAPLVLGQSSFGWCLASDPLALAGICDRIAFIPNHAILLMTKDNAALTDINSADQVEFAWQPAPKVNSVELGAYRHFMAKEIHEQLGVVQTLINRYRDVYPLFRDRPDLMHIILTGCGSASYAAMMGKEWLQEGSQRWIEAIPASEITESTRNLGPQTGVIALTQSGETADVVDALRIAHGWGAATAVVVNVEQSSAARLAETVIPLLAGPERSVLATKSFMAMVVRMLQLSTSLSQSKSQLSQATPLLDVAFSLPLDDITSQISHSEHVIVLGKGASYQIARESALKITEGSYVHASAFYSGELKHGPLALIEQGTPCLLYAISAAEVTAAKTAAKEIMTRGGFTIGIGPFEANDCDIVIDIPDIGKATILPMTMLAQRIGYEVACKRRLNPDYPRNLAKSVTVR